MKLSEVNPGQKFVIIDDRFCGDDSFVKLGLRDTISVMSLGYRYEAEYIYFLPETHTMFCSDKDYEVEIIE